MTTQWSLRRGHPEPETITLIWIVCLSGEPERTKRDTQITSRGTELNRPCKCASNDEQMDSLEAFTDNFPDGSSIKTCLNYVVIDARKEYDDEGIEVG